MHLVDTGELTQTGGRIRRAGEWVKDDDVFLCTYGDGVAGKATLLDLEAA